MFVTPIAVKLIVIDTALAQSELIGEHFTFPKFTFTITFCVVVT